MMHLKYTSARERKVEQTMAAGKKPVSRSKVCVVFLPLNDALLICQIEVSIKFC